MKKIAFVIFSLVGGGAEKNAIDLCDGLFSKYECEIITLKTKNEYHSYIQNKKVKVISLLNTEKTSALWLKPLLFIVGLIKFLLLISQKRYSLLIGCTEFIPFYFVCIASVLFRIKNILIIGDHLEFVIQHKPFFLRHFIKICMNICLRFASKIVCVSQGLKISIANSFQISSNKITVIYNGVAENKSHRSHSASKRILTIGRLTSIKGHQHLIKVFSHVINKLPSAELFIVGNGPDKTELTLLIRNLHLEKKVHLIPFTNPSVYYSKCDIYICTSIYETFGNTIIEAMSYGLPVISTDCPFGPREILNNGKYGILTPPFLKAELNDEDTIHEKKMAQEIIEILTQNTKRKFYSNQSKMRVKQFTFKKMLNGYKKLIQKTL